MEKKKIIFCLIGAILCFVGAAVVFNIATETGIMDNSIKIGIGSMIVGGLAFFVSGIKGFLLNKKDK
ncbi:hypothetical protein [uncultured Acetatifactor sp.]|uniref:hypothetical protein n=1 Tax=uncultured Acetatifactor sp. TaxID=1671927 RepID=UPI0026122EB9|nr:hypothetical protein [uncultured Acetatifactor sp.]